jgi:hypothetical protein
MFYRNLVRFMGTPGGNGEMVALFMGNLKLGIFK